MAEYNDTTFYAMTAVGGWVEIKPDFKELNGIWNDRIEDWDLHEQVALLANHYGLEISATQTIKVTLNPGEAQEYLPK